MKIGFISDTHGSLERLQLAVGKYFADAALIVHAGDVMYHGPRNLVKRDYNPLGIAEYLNALKTPLLIAKGNCDSEVDASCLEAPLCNPYGFAQIGGLNIAVTHGHYVESEAEKDVLARKLKADILVCGHIHVPVLERRSGVIFLNPGSPAFSKRADGKQTVGLLDGGEIKIIDIDADEVLMRLSLGEAAANG